MDFFTPGNLLAVAISLALVVIFRQMDKNNRSLEKIKKFGDKLKDDLDGFVRERMAALEESSIALEVQQTKAVAAVKRLESIRDDLERREADLLERTKAVEGFGAQVERYDGTLKQLLEMTSLAETNLSRIRSESDFADSLARKLMASKKQLEDIESTIPALENHFAEMNRVSLSKIHDDVLAATGESVSAMELRVSRASEEGETLLAKTGERLKELYQKALAEAAKKADSLEDAAFAKLKEQAAERLSKYKQAAEKKTAALQADIKERIHALQAEIKGFHSSWRAEAEEFLEATRSDIRTLDAKSETEIVAIDERLRSARELSESRSEELASSYRSLEASLEASFAELAGKLEGAVRSAAERSKKELGELDGRVAATAAELGNRLDGALTAAAEEAAAEASRLEESLATRLQAVEKGIASALEGTSSRAEGEVSRISGRLEAFTRETETRLSRFDSLIGDAERLDSALRNALEDTERRVSGDFDRYAAEQAARQEEFERRLGSASDVLSGRMQELENGLNELKSKAYDNVSERLKIFEDDFFADLAKRSDEIGTALERWKDDVESRLGELAAGAESERAKLEGSYTAELKERLAAVAEQYRMQSSRLEEQISAVEGDLRSRITASDQSILDFANQLRADFEAARSSADQNTQNELKAHRLSVQDLLRRQEQEIEAKTREFIDSVEAAKADAEGQLSAVRSEFAAWQQKNAQQLEDARQRLEERVAELGQSADSSISDIETVWQTKYRDWLTRADSESQRVSDTLTALQQGIDAANEDLERRSREALSGFTRSYEAMTAETAKRIRDTGAETDEQIRTITGSVQEIREQVELTRERLMQKLQGETGNLAQTLEEIDRKQKAFIAQTRVFDRAEELRKSLENGIESLTGELSRLEVYRETMATLEGQYQKVRKLEEESSQKMAKFLAEKKRIDILESDFTKLLGLSDSIDRKLSELTGTNDDLQQWQVQLRRFDEIVGEVNGRYERLEKKSSVLDQTVTGVDRAFESLKGLEGALAGYRKDLAPIPAELAEIKKSLETLLTHRERTEGVLGRLEALDDVLADVEARTEKMQTAREWLARTETRLEEISKQSQEQLKLLGAIMKAEGPATKTKGAPALGIRENVIKLAHQGWKVDEIARVFQLSRGEVELILELPQK